MDNNINYLNKYEIFYESLCFNKIMDNWECFQNKLYCKESENCFIGHKIKDYI